MNSTTILIVEDETIVAADLAAKMEQLGHTVVGTAVESDEAVAMAKALHPQLVLMDIQLEGEKDGIETARAIQAHSDIPVIYLTAHSDPATLSRAKLTGPSGYILKPFELRDLATQVELALYKHHTDRQLREQRQWLQVTLDSIGDAVIATDETGTVTFLNPVAERLTGWPADDAVGRPLKTVFRIVNETTREPVDDPVEKVLRSGGIVGLANHTVLLQRRGGEVPIDDSGAPIHDKDGDIIGVVLIFRDIGRRREAERALEDSEARLSLFIEHAPAALAMFDRDMRYLSASRRWITDYHLEGREIIGQSHYAIFPEIGDEWKAVHRRCLAGAVERAEAEPFERDDGTVQWIHWEVRPWRGHDDEIGGIVIFSEDITEQKHVKETLGEINRRYRTLFERSVDGICLHDLDGRILDVNPATERQSGYSRRELLNLTIFDLIADGDREEILARWRRWPVGHSAIIEDHQRRKDGSRYPIEINSGKVAFQGEERILAVVRDVSERHKSEKERERLREQLAQAQKMESVGRLAGGVAHDFNNMLGAIIGHAELAMEQVDPASPLQADLEEIMNAAQRSANLTRQLLAFARKQTIRPKVLDLNDTITDMIKMLRRLIGEDIDLAWMPGADLRPIKVDPAQTDQLLANLCINARDAIDGVGRITIETKNMTVDAEHCGKHAGCVPGPYVMLAVSDDGCGMDRETRENLFEPFFTTKDVGQGTGLGLSTVYGIVRQNGGYIDVTSEPGQGATFKIYLPAAGAILDAPRHPAAPVVVEGDETLLLVEDEPAILRLAAAVLRRLGYTVLSASSPDEALTLARSAEAPIDLLLTDVVMPDMNGQQLATRLRETLPDMKVLYMSGYTADAVAHRGILEADVNFLQKPFSNQALARKVREVLD